MKFTTVAVLMMVAAFSLVAGCAKDPQVLVTPFVLKSDKPISAAPAAVATTQPCTTCYEQTVSR